MNRDVTTRRNMQATPGVPVYNTEAHRAKLRDERLAHRSPSFQWSWLWKGPVAIALVLAVGAITSGGRDAVQKRRTRDHIQQQSQRLDIKQCTDHRIINGNL